MNAQGPSSPSCPRCTYDLSGAAAALRERGATGETTGEVSSDRRAARPPGRGVCSECGQEFAWEDAYRGVNSYFDDLPRAGLWGGFGRSLLLALFPWTSWKVESAARFRLRRTWLVTAVACAVWHALAAAWVMLMQTGWLSPWGTMGRWPLWRVAAESWSLDWGYVIGGAGGTTTVWTMGGNGMIEAAGIVAVFWSVGVILLGLVIAARPRPNCGLLWARAAVRSIPVVGLLTLIMSAEYVVATSVANARAPGGWPAGSESVGVQFLLVLLLGVPPALVLFLTWTRHVRDTGLFGRTWPIVTAMVAVPIVAGIGMALWRGG